MPLSPQCEAGCMSFDGGEVKHHRDCVHYPESLTKLWHDLEDRYVRDLSTLEIALRKIRNEVGTSTLAWRLSNDALKSLTAPIESKDQSE